jgi:hypothetical protein
MTQVQLSMRDLSRLVVLHIQKGKSRDEVVQVLVARGWPEVSAARFVDMILFEQGRSARAWPSEEEQHPTRQTSSASPGSRKAFFVLVIVALALLALFIASVLTLLGS